MSRDRGGGGADRAPAPLDEAAFSRLMAPLGPFEDAPHLAVAVSGGADSLALTLLAHDWARRRGGRVTALTVDHGLRPESAAEAAQVGVWLGERGIAHHALVRTGPRPNSDLQAAARTARYRLLGEACAARGILHLLLAHHRDDQAETLLLRLGRGSGLDGLAAMEAERPTPWGRLLRPLLAVPRAALEAGLRHMGQEWVRDPSNQDTAFARVRLRRMGGDLAAEGLTPDRLAATADRLGRARRALDSLLAEAAARSVRLDPAGFARLDPAGLAALPEEVGLRLLSRLVLVVGGGEYGPRLDRLERLYGAMTNGLAAGHTLAGCRIVPVKGAVIVCREPARVAPPVCLRAGERIRWDGRFEAVAAADTPSGLSLGALGVHGRGWVARAMGTVSPAPVPACALATLPALYGDGGILAVPHLGYNREGGARVLLGLRAAPAHVLAVSACARGNRYYV